MIGIIDYGMGNLGSVTNACSFLRLPARIVTRPAELDSMGAVILPGVGAFGDCMRNLRAHGFAEVIREWIAADRPFLGICLGLQVLFDGSDESPGEAGLGVLPGTIRRFTDRPGLKVPQMGWNRLQQTQAACPLFQGIPDQAHFYFVHSYRADADLPASAGVTEFGERYSSVVWRGHAAAVQFHPEKSQQMGLRLLRNFAVWARVGPEVAA
jgi:glutamine amidotransferase